MGLNSILFIFVLGLSFHNFSRVTLFLSTKKLSIYEFFVGLSVGLCVFSILYLFLKKCGVDIRLFTVVFLLSSIVFRLIFRKQFNFLFPNHPFNCDFAFYVMVSLVFFAPYILQLIRMGDGEYPRMYYNVDSSYYLAQIQALIQSATFPIKSLSNLDVEISLYHYGAQAAVGLISEVSSIPAFKVMFWVVYPLIYVGIISLYVMISNKNKNSKYFFVFILFFITLPINNLVIYSIRSLYYMNSEILSYIRDLVFQNGFQILLFSTQFAIFLFLFLFYCIFYSDSKKGSTQFSIVIALVALGFFKLPWLVGVGLGYAGFAAYRLVFREYIYFSCGVVALALLTVLYLLTALSPSSDSMFPIISFGSYFSALGSWPFGKYIDDSSMKIVMGVIEYFGKYIPYLAALGYIIYVMKKPVGALSGLKPLILAIPTLVLFNIVGMKIFNPIDSKWIMHNDVKQFLDYTNILIQISFSIVLFRNLPKLSTRISVFNFTVLTFVNCVYIVHFIEDESYSGKFKNGGEYANNRSIAEVLKEIPLGSSVIVTNDFAYPAENHARKLNQFQIPAILGHQCFACSFDNYYEQYPDSNNRYEVQKKLFLREDWDKNVPAIAKKYKWTHLLLSKRVSYPQAVELNKLSENKEYVLYEF